MTQVRLLTDTPEGARGAEVAVAAERARALVSAGQAERVITREVEVERTVRQANRGDRRQG